ncbi:MAG: hypothetical protein ABIG39_01575 [Candidatus Micrarchaeota archaeon]
MQKKFSDKSIICDASSLISITESCLFGVIDNLNDSFDGNFVISPKVKYECIDNPIKMKSHALTAVRLKSALQTGRLCLAPKVDETEMVRIAGIANKIYRIGRKSLRIIHLGEADMIATARDVGTRNILIDERTTRMLVEDPEKLKKHMEREFRKKIEINEEYLKRFQDMTGDLVIIRSSELVMVAHQRGYFKRFGELEKKAVESALYGLKFNGCGISFSEIDEFCNMME